jgi:DtxR family Mn-dependent transcriptional regulator
MLHKAEEDYIKFIFEATSNHQMYLSLKEIASYFSYTEQSVNEMIKKLDKKGYVSYVPYQGVKLLKKGKNEAIRMIRSHRIWEVFLEKYLGYSWEEVHKEAEHLEHAGSEKMIEKMYAFIGKPKTCQHGNPIPSYDEPFESNAYQTLFDLEEGVFFKVLQVKDNYELLYFLNSQNIQIGDDLKIIKKYPALSQIEIMHQNNTMFMSDKIAQMIQGKTHD